MTAEFRLERLIDASPEEVFDALVDPDEQLEWWSPDDAVVRTSCDLRVGGVATVEWGPSESELTSTRQVFVEIDRPSKLVYTEVVTERGAPTYECLLTFTLEAAGGKTRLVLVHTGFPDEAERDKHHRGTAIFFDRLERHLAGNG